jgi:O-methyltransferase
MSAIAERYLDLLKKSILNELYLENEARLVYYAICAEAGHRPNAGIVREISRFRADIFQQLQSTREEGSIAFVWDVPQADGSTRRLNLRNYVEVYHSMIGRKRLDNIHHLMDRVIADDIAGDIIETGVWRGGATVFMRGYLAAHGIDHRRVWVADSFEGLPVPTNPNDAGYDYSASVFPILAISRREVEELFDRYGLLDDRVEFLEGWFKDTLPTAPVERLALMRLDGDLYESTMDALTSLYDRLSVGGFVIIDDYNDFAPCRRAVTEFRDARGIDAKIHNIDWTGVYWQKVS